MRHACSNTLRYDIGDALFGLRVVAFQACVCNNVKSTWGRRAAHVEYPMGEICQHPLRPAESAPVARGALAVVTAVEAAYYLRLLLLRYPQPQGATLLDKLRLSVE